MQNKKPNVTLLRRVVHFSHLWSEKCKSQLTNNLYQVGSPEIAAEKYILINFIPVSIRFTNCSTIHYDQKDYQTSASASFLISQQNDQLAW